MVKSQKRNKLFIMLVLLLCSAIVVVWWVFGQNGEAEKDSAMETAQIISRDFSSTVLATGSVKPQVGAKVNVGTRISGKVENLNVTIGDRVVKGQVLAVIEHQDMLAQVAQKEALLTYVSTQIAALKSRRKTELARADALVAQRESEVASEQQRLESVTARRQQDLDSEQEKLESVRQQRNAEAKLSKTRIVESKATHEFTTKEVGRMKTLYEKDMLSEQSMDKAVTEERVTNARLRSAERSLTLAHTRLSWDVSVQQKAVSKAETSKIQDIAVQEKAVGKAKAALEVAHRERDAIASSIATDIQILESSLPRYQAELDEARIRLSYAQVTAPISGIVGTISTNEGETVVAGFNAPTFVSIIDLERLQVDAYVDEVDIGKIRTGKECFFTVDAFPDREFHGRVVAIYPDAVIQDNVVNYDVVIDISSPFKNLLRTDMTASVTIYQKKRKGVLMVPRQAIIREGGHKFVLVQSSNGPPQKKAVKTGTSSGGNIEIVSGVNEGDTVVIENR